MTVAEKGVAKSSSFPVNKVRLDLEYSRHQSFWLDIKIVWMTFFKVIKRDGVTH